MRGKRVSHAEADPASREHVQKVPFGMISHYSRLKLCWDVFMFICVCYIAFYTPLDMAFEVKQTKSQFVWNSIVDIVFWVDILVCFRTTIVTENGTEEVRGWVVAKEYINGFLWIDVVSCLPGFPLSLAYDAGAFANAQNAKVLKVAKLSKAMRGLKVARLVRLFNFEALIAELEQEFVMARKFSWGLKLIGYAFGLSHFNACIFVSIATWRGQDMMYSGPSWMASYGGMGDMSLNERYWTALYWSFTTITTVGYGDISPRTHAERVYCIFAMLVGCAFYGYVIGNISVLMATLNLNKAQYAEKMEGVMAYLSHRQFPRVISRRLYSYFSYYYSQRSAVDEDELLQALPAPLREQVASHMLQSTIRDLKIFKFTHEGATSVLIPLMKPVLVLADEFVMEQGDEGTDIYILTEGTVRVRPSRARHFEVKAVECFGQWTCFGKTGARLVSIDCRTDCKFLTIDGAEMVRALHDDYPAELEHMRLVVEREWLKFQARLRKYKGQIRRWQNVKQVFMNADLLHHKKGDSKVVPVEDEPVYSKHGRGVTMTQMASAYSMASKMHEIDDSRLEKAAAAAESPNPRFRRAGTQLRAVKTMNVGHKDEEINMEQLAKTPLPSLRSVKNPRRPGNGHKEPSHKEEMLKAYGLNVGGKEQHEATMAAIESVKASMQKELHIALEGITQRVDNQMQDVMARLGELMQQQQQIMQQQARHQPVHTALAPVKTTKRSPSPKRENVTPKRGFASTKALVPAPAAVAQAGGTV